MKFVRELAVNNDYEVIVAGGGPSGVAAALSAARLNKKVLLLEASGSLGGMATIGLVPAWCPFSDKEKIIYRSIAEEIFTLTKKVTYNVSEKALDWVPINKEGLKRILDELMIENNVDVLFNSFICGVEKKDDRNIDGVLVASKQGLSMYQAKVYIDTTSDADLVNYMGGEFYIEEDVQPCTHCFIIGNVNMEEYYAYGKIHGDIKGCKIYDIIKDPKYPHIVDHHICNNPVGNGVIGFNAGHIYEVNPLNVKEVSKALMDGRRMAFEYLEALKEYHPKAFKDACLIETAPSLGVRESRRIKGDYVLTVDDYVARRTFEDEIGRNSYYIDVHYSKHEQSLYMDGKLDDVKRAASYKKGESHGIPYRCLVPKDLDNVLVAGRTISTERMVQGSTRVMPTCLVTGEACGVAASIMIDDNKNNHDVDTKKIREVLFARGAYIK